MARDISKLVTIPGELHSAATGNIVVAAEEVFDYTTNKYQKDINQEVAYIKEDSSVDPIPSFNPQSQTVHIDEQVLSNTQKKQVRKNIGLGNGDIDSTPTSGSDNVVRSGGVYSSMQELRSTVNPQVGYYTCSTAGNTAAKVIDASGYTLLKGGGLRVNFTEKNTAANATLNIEQTGAKPLYYNGVRVSTNNSWYAGEIMTLFYDGAAFQLNSLPDLDEYDVSARNGGQAFTFDEAVALVPEAYRHGGLKLKFISNRDSSISGNKYVQYRLMATAWSNIIADWQGVDNEPTAGSNNLVKSGGVAEKLSELESEVKLEFGTIPYEYSTNIPCLIDGKFNNGDVLFFETDKNNGGATTLGGYIVEGGFEDIIIASPPGRMHRIVLNNSYDRLSLFSSKNGKAKVYMEDSINQKLNSINTELGGIDARIESATTTETDISSEFVPGYWNTNNGVGQQAYFSESSTLFTLKINITKGQIYISNTELATNQAVSHALLDNNNTIIALLTTQELNNGVQITDAIIESGATNIVITYRSTLQTTPISCIVKERVTDSVENIKSELQEIENDKIIYRHYVSKTQDTIFVYTKGYAIGEDLCCRMMNRNINGIWDFFDWQRIPNTTDIVASTFDRHILINGGTGTDYISAYTVAAVNNADGDSQVINPTGGWHGYNSLTANVTATARTIMLKVFADGKEVGENESAYCNDVKIMFVNNVQGWNTQKADGTGREILQQKCTIIFNKFDINIEIETTALEDVKLIKHYGLNAQNNMNSSDVVVQFVGELRTIPQSSNGQSSDKESRMLRFCGDNDIFSLTIDNFGEGTFKYNALEYSGIYVGATKKGYFGCIYRNAESEQDWVELSKGASLFLKGSYECKANL